MLFHWLLSSVINYALASCDPDWVAFQGSCYKLTPNPPENYMSILESRWECLRIGADLVKIKTEEEHNFLIGILGAEQNGAPIVSFGVYIAAGDGPQEGLFQWFDGTLVGDRAKWRGNNPDNGGDGISENCVRMRSGYSKGRETFVDSIRGQWVDVPCLQLKGNSDSFLCQRTEVQKSSLREHSFRIRKKHYFNGHHMGYYTVTNYMKCLSLCLAQYSCLSANVRISGPITDNCVLNNATLWEDRDAMITKVTDYIDPRDWTYYEVNYPAYRL